MDRVIEIATRDRTRSLEWLPRLVVVTYTNRAADEMQQRTRNELLSCQVDGVVLTEALIRLCQIAITVPKKKAPSA